MFHHSQSSIFFNLYYFLDNLIKAHLILMIRKMLITRLLIVFSILTLPNILTHDVLLLTFDA